jgi:hypothetical protein
MDPPIPILPVPSSNQLSATGAAPQSRPSRLLADAAGAAALALVLLLVFLIDQFRSPVSAGGDEAAAGPGRGSIFDVNRPFADRPIAEVRADPERKQWIGGFGGNGASEAAARAGLDWLARHQAEDGHWGPDCLSHQPNGRCKADKPCGGSGAEHAVAQTALAVLAMQAGGHYDFNKQDYSDRVRKGLDWLVTTQRDDGCFINPHSAGRCNMYEHGIATFALADACEMAESAERPQEGQRYRKAAQKAVRFIVEHQHDDGGWRYTEDRYERSDTSVSGWQILALKAAKRGKVVDIDPPFIERVEKFFKTCELNDHGRTAYQPGSVITNATTGVGMLFHQFILERPDSPLVKEAAKYLADLAEGSQDNPVPRRRRRAMPIGGQDDMYMLYNCTLAMFQAGGQEWKRWNDVNRDRIIELQRKEENQCVRGSWDPCCQWDGQGGRIYTTALGVLTLEVYYRYKSERAQVYLEPAEKP